MSNSMSDFYPDTTVVIKKIISARFKSTSQLCERMDVTRQRVSSFKLSGIPTLNGLSSFCNACDIKLSSFFMMLNDSNVSVPEPEHFVEVSSDTLSSVLKCYLKCQGYDDISVKNLHPICDALGIEKHTLRLALKQASIQSVVALSKVFDSYDSTTLIKNAELMSCSS